MPGWGCACGRAGGCSWSLLSDIPSSRRTGDTLVQVTSCREISSACDLAPGARGNGPTHTDRAGASAAARGHQGQPHRGERCSKHLSSQTLASASGSQTCRVLAGEVVAPLRCDSGLAEPKAQQELPAAQLPPPLQAASIRAALTKHKAKISLSLNKTAKCCSQPKTRAHL